MAAAPVKKAPTALCVAKAQHFTSGVDRQSAAFLHWVPPRAAGVMLPPANIILTAEQTGVNFLPFRPHDP